MPHRAWSRPRSRFAAMAVIPLALARSRAAAFGNNDPPQRMVIGVESTLSRTRQVVVVN